MLLASWNVNGIRSIHKRGYFLPFIDKVKPDVLCLQETKAEQHQSEVDLPDYEEYWNSSKARKGYSGTAIFTKKQPETVLFDLPDDLVEKYGLEGDAYGSPNKEGRVIAAEYKDFFLVTAYTPNAKPDLSRLTLREKGWDPAFLEYCKRLEKKKPVIFCGDLNVAHTELDLANPKQNEGEHGFTKEEREGVDKMLKAGFHDAFRHFNKEGQQYTWWSNFSNARARNVGWRIDYFFVSSSLMRRVRSAKIHPEFYGSDHCPVSIKLDIEP